MKNTDNTRYIPYVCGKLGIDILNANTPQAKGRVERVNRTLQDRLVKDLARHRISSIERANEFLTQYFLPRFNQRFVRPPKDPTDAHVQVVDRYDIESRFAKQWERKVAPDWTFSIDSQLYQILKPPASVAFRRDSKIIALQYLDNSLKVFYNNTEIHVKEVG